MSGPPSRTEVQAAIRVAAEEPRRKRIRGHGGRAPEPQPQELAEPLTDSMRRRELAAPAGPAAGAADRGREQLEAHLRSEMERLIGVGLRDASASHEGQLRHALEIRGAAGTFSDFVHDVTPPSLVVWGNARRSLEAARSALQAGRIRNAHIYLLQGYRELVRAQDDWHTYLGETIAGAEQTVETLRTIRDGAIAVEVGLLTGGVAYGALGGGSAATAVSTVAGLGAATDSAAHAPSALGAAVRGTIDEVVDTGAVGNLRLAAHGLGGMIMGLGHGLSQIPAGLAAAARGLATLFTDPQRFADDAVRFREGLEALWESRDALWSAFDREPPERQAHLVGELFGHIESSLVAMEATRAVGRGLPGELSGRVTGTGLGAAAGGGRKGAALAVVTSRLVKLRLETIKKLIALGALDPALAAGAAGGSRIGAAPLPGLEPLFVQTPSGTVVAKAGTFAGKSVTFGDSRAKHTKVGQYVLAVLKEAARKRPKESLLLRMWEAIDRGDKSYGGQLSKEACDRYQALITQALERGIERAGKFYFEDATEIGIDIETGKPTRVYRVDGAPSSAHIIPLPRMP